MLGCIYYLQINPNFYKLQEQLFGYIYKKGKTGKMSRNKTLPPPPPKKMKALLVFVLTVFATLSVISVLSEDSYSANLSPSPGPKNLSVEIKGSVTLDWDAPSDAADEVTGYQILRKPFLGENTLQVLVNNTETNETVYTDLNATEPQVRYVYRVKAWRNGTLSRWSNYDFVDLPRTFGAPTNLTADLVDGYVTLKWDAPANDARSVTGYEILRRKPFSGESTLLTLVNDTGTKETTYIDLNATEPNTRYVYRVKALRGGDKSRWSNYDRIKLPENYSAPPPVISGTIAFINSSDVSEDNESYTYDYSIEGNNSFVNNTYTYLNFNTTADDERLVYITSEENNPPEFNQSSYTFNLAENRNGPISLGFVGATDPDGDNITYYLINDRFNINSSTGEITYIGGGENYETKSRYTFTVDIEDENGRLGIGGGSFVTVNITDVNEAPEFSEYNYIYYLDENVEGPVIVGKLNVTDPDGDNLTFTITGQDSSDNVPRFDINSSTGELIYIYSGTDYEDNTEYGVNVRVSDGSLRDDAIIIIFINDVNDAPVLTGETFDGYYRLDFDENLDGSSTPVFVGNMSATDDDGDNLTYNLNFGNDASGKFEFNSSAGELTYIGTGENFEVEHDFSLHMVVSDGSLSDEASIHINVNDVNEAPELNQSSYDFSFNENLDGSSTPVFVGNVTATDVDDGDNETLTYSIISGNTNKFNINSLTGEITYVGRGENYETKSQYSLTVNVEDERGLSDIGATITINITDVNDPPKFTGFNIDNRPEGVVYLYDLELPENYDGSSTPFYVFHVTATDEDGDDLTYNLSFGNDASGKFEYNSSTGRITYVGNGENYESYEEDFSFELELTVSDGFLSTDAEIYIYIHDENDPPEFSQDSYNFSLNGNANGSSTPVPLGNVSATDEDSGDTLTYSITSGDTDKFNISSTTGEITYIGSGEDGSTPTYSLNIRVGDGEISVQTTVRITIKTNNAPQFNQNFYAFNLSENRDGSTTPIPLGFVNATDDDGDPLTYSITSGATNKFNINSLTGEITYVGRGENYETKSQYSLTVNVEDEHGLSDIGAIITINITDVNDPPKFDNFGFNQYFFYLPENRDGSSTPFSFPRIFTTDEDGDDLEYSIDFIGSNTTGKFEFNSSTGELTYVGNGENHESYREGLYLELELTVSDGSLSTAAQILIGINDENDPPEFSQDSYNFSLKVNVNGSSTPFPLGTATATDEDSGDTLTYSITSGDTDKFNISSTTGEITYIGSGEDGTTPTYSLNISVGDAEFSAQTSVQITIKTNNAPEFQGIATGSLDENQDGSSGGGIFTGFVRATDSDGDNLTFSITSGNTSKFRIDESNGEVYYIGDGEDYESYAIYKLIIEVSDGSLTDSTPYDVFVRNVNEAPKFPFSQGYSDFYENEKGDDVYFGVLPPALDPENDTINYSIIEGDTSKFRINSSDRRIIYISDGEDYESGTTQYNLTFQASDGSLNDTLIFIIDLNDVNEAPELTERLYKFSLDENLDGSVTPVSVGNITATDPEDDDLSYTLTFGSVGDYEDYGFKFNESTGEITNVGNGVDYENKSRYTFSVVAFDGSIQSEIGAVIIDIIDNPLEFNQRSWTFNLREKFSGSTTPIPVVTVNATDENNNTLTYSITSGNADNKFNIDETTGEITYIGDGEDYDSTTRHNLVVGVSGGGNNDNAAIRVNVKENRHPRYKNSLDDDFYFNENLNGSLTPVHVGNLSPRFKDDDGDIIIYSVRDFRGASTRDKFKLNETSGEITYVGEGEDHEAPNFFSMLIWASDNVEPDVFGPFNSYYIHVNDVNEAPVFNQSLYNFTFNGNANGSSTPVPVGFVNATDEDVGDTLTYSITSGNTGKFNINSTTGAIAYIGSGEGGSTPTYSLNISVNDTEFSDQTSVKITIKINNAPEFPRDVASDNLKENLNGSSGSGIIIGIIPATDPDGDNLTCSITEGDTNKFRVDFNHGTCDVYYIGGGEDYEGLLSSGFGDVYDLTITVSDGFLNDTIDYDVFVENVNEAPDFQGSGYSSSNIDENRDGSSDNIYIHDIPVTDPENDNLNYSITSGDTSKFRIDKSNGYVYYIGGGEDYESLLPFQENQYELTIEVSDGEYTDSHDFTCVY